MSGPGVYGWVPEPYVMGGVSSVEKGILICGCLPMVSKHDAVQEAHLESLERHAGHGTGFLKGVAWCGEGRGQCSIEIGWWSLLKTVPVQSRSAP